MIRVRFEPSGFEVDVEPGESIIDITDEHPAADVPYSCRSATCGTCRVSVEAGGDALSDADIEELEVLDIFGDTPDQVRLCCQTKVIGGESDRVVLRVVDAD